MTRPAETLREKLHPTSIRTSGKMTAIIASILGESWTEPELFGLAITSDGYVTSIETFIGDASDFDRNVEGMLAVADLTPEERAEWDRLYAANVDDWRTR